RARDVAEAGARGDAEEHLLRTLRRDRHVRRDVGATAAAAAGRLLAAAARILVVAAAAALRDDAADLDDVRRARRVLRGDRLRAAVERGDVVVNERALHRR